MPLGFLENSDDSKIQTYEFFLSELSHSAKNLSLKKGELNSTPEWIWQATDNQDSTTEKKTVKMAVARLANREIPARWCLWWLVAYSEWAQRHSFLKTHLHLFLHLSTVTQVPSSCRSWQPFCLSTGGCAPGAERSIKNACMLSTAKIFLSVVRNATNIIGFFSLPISKYAFFIKSKLQ